MNYRVVSALLASCLPLFTATAVSAHAHLLSQVPASDATVTASPQTLTLTFSEAIEQPFSRVTLIDAARQPVSSGQPQRSTNNPAQLIVPIQDSLRAGVYDVQWPVLSVDGHETHGSYCFTVK